ncbi:MAG: NrdH-redoxin [Burkholderiales bacterium RIFCSPLOWO2_12_67_14]|nr:MAG: NrdH-redoxin [Burkholderiales bacterium RIFCSPLOWO2_02_FULL_67_64]OGB38152.1 MAG: NrdH-redoxin [Burkholderiales bacterium RIFCSPHIGHO2_12_FULL_67_38]OGB51456.1 MAG: NrdH-redoxin [Burkholderiales bacterium RIFCSPLOWO2_12_67_14]OGB96389.1 MAG: NrdH-redoxin [Burkholderiales bacterium RIFCSPLOWO2_12_FULL_67_210]
MLGLLCALAASSALAQGVYRIVGPDGRVTYSDQPPPANAEVKPVSSGGSTASANAPLPFELRQVAGRYPVTVYTGKDCAPCNSGRNLLNARGIPYSEKTVDSKEDVEALKRLSGDTSLPFITIGGQQIKGYSDAEWTQYLDAAGYPKQSTLPTTYRRPAASPLVAVKPAPAARPASPENASREPAAPAEPSVTPPAGIRF